MYSLILVLELEIVDCMCFHLFDCFSPLKFVIPNESVFVVCHFLNIRLNYKYIIKKNAPMNLNELVMQTL